MIKDIFRQKSLDKVRSPESLNDYIRVSNPGVWVLLAAVTALLVGAFIWGIFGHMETVTMARAISEGGVVTCIVSEQNVERGMEVRAGGSTFEISQVSYNAETGKLTCRCELKDGSELNDGIYDAEIVTEDIEPIKFLFN